MKTSSRCVAPGPNSPVRATALAVLALVNLAAPGMAAPQDLAGPSPFPHRMPGYRFHASLAEALNAGRLERRVVVFSVDTTRLANQLGWLMRQRTIFAHPVTRRVLADHPIVALRSDSSEGKALRIPATGLSIMSADGKRIERTIDLTEVKPTEVPGVLAQILAPGQPVPEQAGDDPDFEWRNFRAQRAKLLNLLDSGQAPAAEQLCREEELRAPDAFGPRLLRNTLRRQTLGADVFSQLPADRPVADALCVVRDDASFLHALAGWGKGPIYPILYLDSQYLPLFLEAFGPARVFVVTAPRAAGERAIDAARLFAAYGAALGGDLELTGVGDAVAVWKRDPKRAPGVVFTDPTSRMFAAGLALAAGRRQLLAMLPPVTDPTRRVTYGAVAKLRSAIGELLRAQRIDGMRAYDELEFITLASEQPYRYADELAPDKSSYAVDDCIARDRFEVPFASVGRLLGGREQALYMAMCALFLTQHKALLFSRYQKGEPWGYFGIDRAASILAGKCEVEAIDHPAATLARWQSMFGANRNEHGLVHVNSSGGKRNWTTSTGNGSYDDVPLTVPAIVSYVHSNSLGDGYDADTVGGRWLHNGAYWFFGSTAEPYLDAFTSVYDSYDRAVNRGWPLGAAHRLQPLQQRWRAWKLMLFGDPLVRLRLQRVARVPAATTPVAGALPLDDALRRNPYRLQDLDRRLFALQCQVLQRGTSARVLEQVSKLIRAGNRRAGAVPTAAQTRDLADLLAWAVYDPEHLDAAVDHLLPLAPHLGPGHCASPRLSAVIHVLAHARLRLLQAVASQRQTGERVAALLRLHLSAPHSTLMCRRIGELYKPVFAALPDGKRRHREMAAEVRALIAKGRRELEGFVSAF